MTQPPPGAPYGAPMNAEHPEGTKLLVLSIVGLLCCTPIDIYTLIRSNSILATPSGFDTSKVNTAKIISIVGLALWVVGIIVGLFSGVFSGLSGS